MISLISLLTIANLQFGCALRVYDNGKIALADYGDTDGNMYYKSKTMEFRFVGKRNVSRPTKETFNGATSVIVPLVTGGAAL